MNIAILRRLIFARVFQDKRDVVRDKRFFQNINCAGQGRRVLWAEPANLLRSNLAGVRNAPSSCSTKLRRSGRAGLIEPLELAREVERLLRVIV